MKKHLLAPTLIAALGLATTVASHAQNQVIFRNYFSETAPKITYEDGPYAGLGVGSDIKAQLGYFIGSSSAPLGSLTLLTFSNLYGASPVPFGLTLPPTTSPGAVDSGWFSGGQVTIPGSADQPMTFAIFCFDGDSYDDPQNTYKGVSVPFAGFTQSEAVAPIPDLPAGEWQNMTVHQVPEPSTMALAGLGTAAFLALRRRS